MDVSLKINSDARIGIVTPLLLRTITCVVLIVTILGLASCSDSNPSSDGNDTTSPLTNPPSTDGGLSNLARLKAMRAENGLTKEFAVAQFEAYFGPISADSEWRPDGSTHLFATHVLNDIFSFEEELTPAELDAIYERVVPLNDSEDTGKGTRASPAQTRRADPTLAEEATLMAFRMFPKIGHTLESPIEVVRLTNHDDTFNSNSGDGIDAATLAYAIPFTNRLRIWLSNLQISDFGFESLDSCWIVINEAASAGFDALPQTAKDFTLAHEVSHCFQFEMASTLPLPHWIGEGTASWAAADLIGIGDGPVLNGFWSEYESGGFPFYDLFSSDYSTIGFWSHVSNSITSGLWLGLAPIYQLSGSDQDRLEGVANIIGGDAFAGWPAFGSGDTSWGFPWVSTGVGGRTVKRSTVTPLADDTIKTGEIASLEYKGPEPVDGAAAYFVELEIKGTGYIHWSNSGATSSIADAELQLFCWEGDCVCDSGFAPAGFEMARGRPAGESLLVAMTGMLDGTPSIFSELAVTTIEDACEEEPEPIVITPSARDSCLVGSWTLDMVDMNAQTRSNYLAQSPDNEASDLGTMTGSVTVTFNADGSATGAVDLTNSSVTPATATEPEITFILKMTGSGSFDWSADGEIYSAFPDADFILNYSGSAFFGDLEIPIDDTPINITAEELLGASGDNMNSYECDPRSLLIKNEGENSVSPRYTPL